MTTRITRRMAGMAAVALVGALSMMERSATAQTAGLNVAGTWSTVFAGARATVTLSQMGNNVVGTYQNTPPLLPGAMAGVVRGATLVGRWTDARTSGGFTLAFSPDGRTFTGTWGREITSNDSGGPWSGQRQ